MATPAGKLVRTVVQKLKGTYYEGPDAPKRIAEAVRMFTAAHPHANQVQWVEWAAHYAEECYRSGYVRGLEWAERDFDRRDPVEDPEVLARTHDHDHGTEPEEAPPVITDVDAVPDGDQPPDGTGRRR